jgi:16S rRNA (uracil1498-N3)-methyltransferase
MAAREFEQLFYTASVSGSLAQITGDELHHLAHVLRKRAGDHISITDGYGTLYVAELLHINKNEAEATIISSEVTTKKPYRLHIALALLKNADRMEWCLEKLTEVGMDSFTPVICDRSERQKWNLTRAQKIVLNAMKQSMQAYLPMVNDVQKFPEVVGGKGITGQRYIGMLHPESKPFAAHYERGTDVFILIGPEGDFTHAEAALARENGWIYLDLGSSRLRAETAALTAAIAIHTLNQ